jgi:hypothetical protein
MANRFITFVPTVADRASNPFCKAVKLQKTGMNRMIVLSAAANFVDRKRLEP